MDLFQKILKYFLILIKTIFTYLSKKKLFFQKFSTNFYKFTKISEKFSVNLEIFPYNTGNFQDAWKYSEKSLLVFRKNHKFLKKKITFQDFQQICINSWNIEILSKKKNWSFFKNFQEYYYKFSRNYKEIFIYKFRVKICKFQTIFKKKCLNN